MSHGPRTEALRGVTAKLEAAKIHFDLLQDEMNAFLDTEPYSTWLEFDERESTFHLMGSVLKEPPLALSTRIGDMIHNLACALDYTVYELARHRAGRVVDRTSFPIFGDVRHYRAFRRGRNCWMRCLTAGDRAVLSQLQPYRRGDFAFNHPLVQLYRLWNQDKHRVLHTTVSVFDDGAFKFVVGNDVSSIGTVTAHFGPMKDRAPIASVTVGTDGPDAAMEVEGDLGFEIAFDDGLLVRYTLADIGDFVTSVVAELSPRIG